MHLQRLSLINQMWHVAGSLLSSSLERNRQGACAWDIDKVVRHFQRRSRISRWRFCVGAARLVVSGSEKTESAGSKGPRVEHQPRRSLARSCRFASGSTTRPAFPRDTVGKAGLQCFGRPFLFVLPGRSQNSMRHLRTVPRDLSYDRQPSTQCIGTIQCLLE